MGAPVSSRLSLAAAVALASALCFALVVAASPGAEADSAELRPDLVTMPVGKSDLVLSGKRKHRRLRLSNEIANAGEGPLEIVPGAPGAAGSCADGQFAAMQRVFEETNSVAGFQRGFDTDNALRRFGCMTYHAAPGHDHWHVIEFARYELRRESNGNRAAARKVGFCVIDTVEAFPALRGSPSDPYYGAGCGGPDKLPQEEGLSVGWSDVYYFGLPGQALDVAKLRRGRYCLLSTADPLDQIAESNEANNTHEVRLKLRPKLRKARKGRKLRMLEGACKI